MNEGMNSEEKGDKSNFYSSIALPRASTSSGSRTKSVEQVRQFSAILT